jgi:hypothetical protein
MVFAIIPHPQKRIDIISPSKIATTEGRVLWFEDFEGNQAKFSNMSIVNTSVKVSSGTYAGKMSSAGADPWTTTASTYVIPTSPRLFKTKGAIELSLMFSKDTTAAQGITSFALITQIRDGTNNWYPSFKVVFDDANTSQDLQYLNSSNTYTDITGATGLKIAANIYYRFKLVFDLVSGYYDRLEWGNLSYDLSDLAIRSTSEPHNNFYMALELIGVDADTCDTWIDNISITTDEP